MLTEQVFRQRLKNEYQRISGIFQDSRELARILGIPNEEAARRLESMGDVRERAAAGNRRDKEYLVGVYASLLSQQKDSDCTELLADWPGSFSWLLLELVLAVGCLSQVLEQVEDRAVLLKNDLVQALNANERQLGKALGDRGFCLRFLAGMMFAQEDGQDVLENLQHEDVEELGALRADYVYVVKRGRKIRLEGVCFPHSESLLRIQKKAVRQARPQYDYNRPALTTQKLSGSRVTVAGYHATPSENELYFNERLFDVRGVTLEILQEKYRTIDPMIRRFLDFNQKGRGSFLVTGAEMGVGKSTFLMAMLEKVPDYWGIGILDGCNELKAAERYPDKNILTLIESPRMDLQDSFAHLLKTSRDILCVGEVTQPGEMLCLVQGATRLNAGIGGTLHAASPEVVPACCRNLLKATGLYSDDWRAEEELARSLDLIVHLRRHRHEPGRIVLDQLVQCSVREEGQEPLPGGKPYQLHCLATFDDDRNEWIRQELPTREYMDKICRYVDSSAWVEFAGQWTQSC